MKKYLPIIVIACYLSACGSDTQTEQNAQGSTAAATPGSTTTVTTTAPIIETTTTTVTTTGTTNTTTTSTETPTETPTETTTTLETTTVPLETSIAQTFNTEWYQRDYVLYPECHVDKYVYSAPTRDSEKIGFVQAGSVVINIGYANSEWIVIEWNDGIGFMEVYEVYENPVETETIQTETMPIETY